MNPEFCITRTFEAPRDLMFRLWTEQEHMDSWFGPAGSTVKSSTIDVRPGGMNHFCLELPDGTEIWGRFVYTEVSPIDRLMWIHSFSDESGGISRHPMAPEWPLELLTTVVFQSEGENKTRITLTWVPHNSTDPDIKAFADGMESMNQGWTGTFDKLDEYIVHFDQ